MVVREGKQTGKFGRSSRTPIDKTKTGARASVELFVPERHDLTKKWGREESCRLCGILRIPATGFRPFTEQASKAV